MKTMTAAILLSALSLIMAGCDKANSETSETDATTGTTIPSEENKENGEKAGVGKTLIVFFSRAGENWQVGTVERATPPSWWTI